MNGIDEIYEKSYPVQYCQILTLEKGPTTGKHIIVSGSLGSGKTTVVRQLCKDLSSGSLPNDYTLVVLVELCELTSSCWARVRGLATSIAQGRDLSAGTRSLEAPLRWNRVHHES